MARVKALEDPYMKKTFCEATKLMSEGYHKHAINAYAEYLQQVVVVTTVKYYHIYNPAYARKLQSVFATKNGQKVTLGYVIKMLPNKLRTSRISRDYKYIQNVRNDVSAHPYYALSLSRTTGTRHDIDDVNTKRKYIRRLYKHVRDEAKIPHVENFLRFGHPATIYKESDQLMLKCERLVMEKLCRNVKDRVERIKICLEHELARQTSNCGPIDYWTIE